MNSRISTKPTFHCWIESVTKEALPLVAWEVLGAGVRDPCPPQARPSAHCGRGAGPRLPGLGEGVVVQEPAAVHDAPDPHVAAEAPHQVRDVVQVDQDPGAPGAAAHQVQLPPTAQLLPAEELPDHLGQDLRAEEGEPGPGLGVGRGGARPGVRGAVGHQHVVGVGKVGVLLSVTR